MGVSLIGVGVRQQYMCFDTHTFMQFSTYGLEYRVICHDYSALIVFKMETK